MPPTQRQCVEAAIRHARIRACGCIKAVRTISAAYGDDPHYVDAARREARTWIRLERELRVIPIDAPDAVQRARALLTVRLRDTRIEGDVRALLRCLRGRPHGTGWDTLRYPYLPRERPRLP